MNFYPFHIGDYLSATRHLSWDEDAAYRRLLDAYYTSERPLPGDERQVFRLVVATTEAQREAVRIVLQEFFTLGDDGYTNNRADREIETMKDKQEKQRVKANRRWDMNRAERGSATALPRHAEGCAAAQNERADAMPPTPTPTPKEEHLLPSVGGAGSAQSADPPTQPPALSHPQPPPSFDGTNATILNCKSVVTLAKTFDIPEDWGIDAEKLGWKPSEVMREAEKFRQYWVSGKGAGTRRSVKGWRQTWSTWLGKAATDKR